MRKMYFDEIDVCKGIAMLTVLWHHSFILYPIYMLNIPWCQHAMAINGTYFMVVFFLVSGYLFAHSRKRSFGANLVNKSRRLLIPFFSYAVVNLGIKLLAPSLVNREVESIGSYVNNCLFRGGELWFIYVLFIIFILLPPLLQRIERKWIVAVILLLIAIDQALPGGLFNDIFLYKRVIHYSIFFTAGYLMKDFNRRWLADRWLFVVAALLFMVFDCILVRSIDVPVVGEYAMAAIGCCFVWTASFQLLKLPHLAQLFKFVGKYSLSYYCLNGFVLVITRTVVVKILHFESSVLIVVSIFLVCVVLETLAVLCVRKIPYAGKLIGM